MKSGLYACAGASATARAAACAKRFDDPITKRSNVYFGMRGGRVSQGVTRPRSRRRLPGQDARLAHGQRDPDVARERIARRRLDEAEEVPLDPLAREVVRDDEREAVAGQLAGGDVAEPGRVRRLVEGVTEPAGDVVPEALGGRLDVVVHPSEAPLSGSRGGRAYQRAPAALNALEAAFPRGKIAPICRDFSPPHRFPHLWRMGPPADAADNVLSLRAALSRARRPRPTCG